MNDLKIKTFSIKYLFKVMKIYKQSFPKEERLLFFLLTLNIDEVDNKYKDYQERKKRLCFYLNNNFFLTDYFSVEESGIFNILSIKNNFSLIDYIELDCEISKKFFSKASIIKSKSEIKF